MNLDMQPSPLESWTCGAGRWAFWLWVWYMETETACQERWAPRFAAVLRPATTWAFMPLVPQRGKHCLAASWQPRGLHAAGGFNCRLGTAGRTFPACIQRRHRHDRAAGCCLVGVLLVLQKLHVQHLSQLMLHKHVPLTGILYSASSRSKCLPPPLPAPNASKWPQVLWFSPSRNYSISL